jgi:glutamate-1-semialdehyde 2,1-aminomutase
MENKTFTEKSQNIQNTAMSYSDRLHNVIPAGAHTYSRGDDQYPSNAPQILDRGKGAYVWDPDGKKYLDYGMGLRSVTVGYDHDEISEGAIAAIRKGNNLPRPVLLELEAAELMVSLFPWAEMVKFAKNGSTVTTAAVKLSRAYTGRTLVAVCAEQPFFSYDDWFIGSTAVGRGIPEETKKQTVKFNYNNIASVEKLFAEHPGQIACLILEPATFLSPVAGEGPAIPDKLKYTDHSLNFLHQVKKLCKKNGTVFIIDEMITGFRWDLHGAQALYDIEPDLATFGKGMANGFPLAALIGKREIMDLGGIRKAGAERVFLISTTHGSEMSSFGAFIKTVEVYKKLDVTGHHWSYGKKLMNGLNEIAKRHGVEKYFSSAGFACSPYYFTRDKSGEVSLEMRTLFSQEMVRNGVLFAWISLSYAHGDAELSLTLDAADKAMKVYKAALEEGVGKYLEGPAIKPVFRKYN